MRKTLTVLFTIALMLAAAVPASADPAESSTTVVKDFVEAITDTFPCGGETYDITTVENGVLHTTTKDGTLHLTGTFTGTFAAEPSDGTGTSYTGHFTVWFGANENTSNVAATFTFHVTATGDDGSRVSQQATEHFSLSATGTLNMFMKLVC